MTIPALEKKLQGKCLQGLADNKGMTQAVGKLSCLGREGMKEAPTVQLSLLLLLETMTPGGQV